MINLLNLLEVLARVEQKAHLKTTRKWRRRLVEGDEKRITTIEEEAEEMLQKIHH